MPPRHNAHFDTSNEGEGSNTKTKRGVVQFLVTIVVGFRHLRRGKTDGVSDKGIGFVLADGCNIQSQDLPAAPDGVRTDAGGMAPLQGYDFRVRRVLQRA